MVDNAGNAARRLQTIIYLFHLRYEADAETAGIKLKKELKDNELCRQVIDEMREEISNPTLNLEFGSALSDAEARKYLTDMLDSFDNAV